MEKLRGNDSTKEMKEQTVSIDTAQQETGKQIEELAGQASVLSMRLDEDLAKFETITNAFDLLFQKVEKTQRVNAQAVSTRAET